MTTWYCSVKNKENIEKILSKYKIENFNGCLIRINNLPCGSIIDFCYKYNASSLVFKTASSLALWLENIEWRKE